MRPVYASVIEVCRLKQERALNMSTTREEAIERITAIREHCDAAFTGLDAAATLLDQTLPAESANQ